MNEFLDETNSIVRKLIKITFGIGILSVILIVGYNWVKNSAESIADETNLKVTIQRYEALNDAFNECIARYAKCKLLEAELIELEMERVDNKELRERLIRAKEHYNVLACKYNSTISKINYIEASSLAKKYNDLPKKLKIIQQ